MEESKNTCNYMCIFRVLVFKEAPELLYTGLTRVLGQPRELEKNLNDTDYFDSDINISIPIEETLEYARTN